MKQPDIPVNERTVPMKEGERSFNPLVYRELLAPDMVAMGFLGAMLTAILFTVIGPLGTWETVSAFRRLLYWGLSACFTWPTIHFQSAVVLYLMRFRPRSQIIMALVGGTLLPSGGCTAILFTGAAALQFEFSHLMLPSIYVLSVSLNAPYSLLVHYIACQRAKADVLTAPRDADMLPVSERSPREETARPSITDGPEPGGEAGDSARPPGESAPAVDPDLTAAQEEEAEAEEEEEAGAGDGNRTTVVPAPTDPGTRIFLSRLSRKLDGDLIYVKTDGHYLTAYTTSGSCSILMRFADAVADLGELGMRVHRSYWVAKHHVIESTVRDNRVLLRLTGGHEVPVSRTYVPDVQAAITDRS